MSSTLKFQAWLQGLPLPIEVETGADDQGQASTEVRSHFKNENTEPVRPSQCGFPSMDLP
jgi:hypothetical protein